MTMMTWQSLQTSSRVAAVNNRGQQPPPAQAAHHAQQQPKQHHRPATLAAAVTSSACFPRWRQHCCGWGPGGSGSGGGHHLGAAPLSAAARRALRQRGLAAPRAPTRAASLVQAAAGSGNPEAPQQQENFADVMNSILQSVLAMQQQEAAARPSGAHLHVDALGFQPPGGEHLPACPPACLLAACAWQCRQGGLGPMLPRSVQRAACWPAPSRTRPSPLPASRPAGAPEPLLTSVSLTLPPNQLGLVFGRSGAGKTTLLHLVAGLAQQNSGTVSFSGPPPAGMLAAAVAGGGRGGSAAAGLGSEERMASAGLVFQFPERHFIGNTLSSELVVGWPVAPEAFAERQALSLRTHEVLAAVGLRGLPLDAPLANLSDGYKRCVWAGGAWG